LKIPNPQQRTPRPQEFHAQTSMSPDPGTTTAANPSVQAAAPSQIADQLMSGNDATPRSRSGRELRHVKLSSEEYEYY